MNGASMFWFDTLHDYHFDQSLSLPYDRYRLVNEHRSGHATSFTIDFDQVLSHHLLAYASSNEVTLPCLTLTCYYAFLFKLTNGQKDLCFATNVHGRYKEEFMSIIGMFINQIPLRCQLDPHWSFYQLLRHVQEMMISSLKYSYFPLQKILAQHPNISRAVFLDTFFIFQSHTNQNIDNQLMIGGNRLHSMVTSIERGENQMMSKCDFGITFQENEYTNQLSCTIDASLDLFNQTTIDVIAQRFHSMLKQAFDKADVQMNKPIYEHSIILQNEVIIMQSMNNTEVLLPTTSCIHHEFVSQAVKHPQKLAVELDDQSLSYSELLYYVQVLSFNLLNKQKVLVGDIICQCTERSLSMVS